MGYKIREMREERGWSQERLAELSGVSRQTISGLESGSITVTTTETLRKLASAFDSKVSDIFFD